MKREMVSGRMQIKTPALLPGAENGSIIRLDYLSNKPSKAT